MQCGFQSRSHKITEFQISRNGQRGYMLITLMLALALISIALLAALPDISQQGRRDRELEMTHRGTAYMRAIQHFYKKFGRYPNRVEELENTNNLRFLRKRYKDPINRDPETGKERDFKFLHQTDVSLNNGPVLGQIPGQNVIGGQGGLPGQTGVQGALGALGAQLGGLQQIQGSGSTVSLNPSSGELASGNSSSTDAADGEGNSKPSGSSPSNSTASSGSTSGLNGPVLGGGPILGVASTSKAKTVRVFFEKSHYNDWLFIYVPQADRGGLLTGPVNPGMPTTNLGGVAAGAASAGPGQGQSLGQGINPNQGPSQSPPPQTPPSPGQMPPEQ
jgi:type II secretory pathway pseudopilin PulG